MRESFLKLLRGEPAGEIVWTADLNYWIAGQKQSGTAAPAWDAEIGYLELHRDLGIMPYYYYDQFWVAEPTYDPRIEVVCAAEGTRTIRRWRTPVGELRQEEVYMPESCSTCCTRYPVQTEQDLHVLRYLIEHRRLQPAALNTYPERLELWQRYDGVPCLGLPRSPLAAFMYEWAGQEHAIFFLTDHQNLLREIFHTMEEQEQPILQAVCHLAPPVVHFPDNLASDIMTGFYDDFLLPIHTRRLERLHAAGVACAVHLDGSVRGLLPKLVQAGFDAVEALTPKPGGDLDVAEIRQLAGSASTLRWGGLPGVCSHFPKCEHNASTVIWGGLPGVMFAPPYTWKDVARHLERLLESWRGQRFIVGVADQVPPDGDINFCRRIAEFIRQRL